MAAKKFRFAGFPQSSFDQSGHGCNHGGFPFHFNLRGDVMPQFIIREIDSVSGVDTEWTAHTESAWHFPVPGRIPGSVRTLSLLMIIQH